MSNTRSASPMSMRSRYTRRGQYRYRDRPLILSRGYPLPLGASPWPDGVNFVLLCRYGTAVWLVLCDTCNAEVQAEIPLDPVYNRTGYHWHIRIDGLPHDFCYGYRVDGPKGPKHRYDTEKILLDPTARALSCGRPWGFEGNLPRRSLLTWSFLGQPLVEDAPARPLIPREDTILYELHVRGYTIDPSSGVPHPGTYSGLVEKIDYLKSLGVTAVELMPIDEFDERNCPFVNPLTGERLRDFWGYNPIAHVAPKAAYAVNPEGSAPWQEFCQLVRAFHAEGLEVVLDVVFNHTAEGGENGPVYNYKGLDNSLYYMLDDEGHYLNFTGCGNTVNSNNPIVRELILSGLRNWLTETEVDGLRFDLASVFGRDPKGNVLVEPPIIEMISADPLLADAKLIAEPWDAAGLYQVGSFPGGRRWSVWNGRYRDDVRRFWRGDPGMTSALATRLCGSDDLFGGQGPLHSINFITCHDGFTLYDLVSYNHKHNEANGEGNRDGQDENYSWNCGVEGPTDDPEILALRHRMARNFIATLMLSQGVPMLLGGDEFLRTQRGNNNAWCQDNATSWVNWELLGSNAGFHRFVRMMIALRKRHPALRRKTFFQGSASHPPDITWHGVWPAQPDFSQESRSLAFCLDGRGCDCEGLIDRDIYVAMNAYWEPLTFSIPASPTGRAWRRAVDTAQPSPDDIIDLDEGPTIPVMHPYRLEARSMIVLVSEVH